jgi:hypothetical protein
MTPRTNAGHFGQSSRLSSARAWPWLNCIENLLAKVIGFLNNMHLDIIANNMHLDIIARLKPSGVFLVCRWLLVNHRLAKWLTFRFSFTKATDIGELQQAVSRFLLSSPNAGQSVELSLDGKALRGTMRGSQTEGLHLLAHLLVG